VTDRRLTPANGRVAALSLAGQMAADRYVAGEARRVTVPVTDLNRAPGGPRDRQLLYGATVTVFEDRDGWSFLQSARDGYVGYVARTTLGPARDATHMVATPATHLYRDEDVKSPDLAHLSFGARVTVLHEGRRFWETPEGFVPKSHLRPLDRPFADLVTVAQAHFGTPYLWGGNSILGIDCSGLVQAALLACALPCPGDSDQQRDALGHSIAPDTPPERGDLWFWNGHVGLVVDPTTLIHANAHHMAVAYEPLAAATLRIAAQGDGPVIARKRL
jgi:cell wall-associated NlpC family hydrolase